MLKLSNNMLPAQVVTSTINKTQPLIYYAFGVAIWQESANAIAPFYIKNNSLPLINPEYHII